MKKKLLEAAHQLIDELEKRTSRDVTRNPPRPSPVHGYLQEVALRDGVIRFRTFLDAGDVKGVYVANAMSKEFQKTIDTLGPAPDVTRAYVAFRSAALAVAAAIAGSEKAYAAAQFDTREAIERITPSTD